MSGDHFPSTFATDADRRSGTLDLRLVAVLTVFAAVVLLVPVDEPTLLRVLAGLPLLLFLPGYALSAALFPARVEQRPDRKSTHSALALRSISIVERLVLSVVASVVVVGLSGVVANALVGVFLFPILLIVVAVTLGASLLAYVQRVRLPESRRFAPLSSLTDSSSPGLPGTASAWFLLVAAVLALIVVGASGVAALGPNGEGVTEFYVGGETVDGTIAMGEQSTVLAPGVSETHFLVVEQRQPAATNYTIVARIVDGGDGNGSASTVGEYRLTLDGTDTTVQPVSFSVGSDRADPRIVYYLYEGSAPTTPSQETALRYLAVDLTVESSG